MVDLRTVRRIALSLPEAEDESVRRSVRFSVLGKAFAWTYLRRPAAGERRVPDPSVLAVRCAGSEKEAILASAPTKYFTDAHYNGFPAVLVRLDAIDARELRELLTDAWRCQAPKKLARTLDEAAQ
ncbi:MmcQ/YjbR family DNA-binding protein [Kribbella sp. NPDC050820]|uniref:MmcQ/YjbR family DNA-binding protein n=1 Tax=Kribbella sp. NPDC050820 TaxID=3155408 RepID=UPI0033CA464F